MKKTINKFIYTFAAIVSFTSVAQAQDDNKSDETGKITLTTYIPAQESIPEYAMNTLTNKLNQISTTNGISSSSTNSRFIITANANVITTDLLATAPPMTALTLDITLYIGDGIDSKKFASKTLTLKGVGTNETKAYIDAMKSINQNDTGIQSFVTNAKTKILKYYDTNCNNLIKEAKALDKQGLHEEAFFKLIAIPVECSSCYEKATDILPNIYENKINKDCLLKLAEATNLWNAGQDFETANAAGQILTSIDPKATCYKDAKNLSEKIEKRVLEIDQREWNYKMEVDVNLEKDKIKAYRDIGVSYGDHQPQNVTYNVTGWW